VKVPEERWKIHEMRCEHIEQVLEIEKASFLTPWTQNMFLNELSSPLSYPFIVTGSETKDDVVVCYIIFWMLLEEVHILNLATHPAYRRLGIAHSLLHFSLDFAYKRGSIVYFLEVRRGNQTAIDLYQKVGFALWRIRRNYYADTGEDALIMRLFYGDRAYEKKGNEQTLLP
jgi:ribosomal-protein-alanine N-acetyltransferase